MAVTLAEAAALSHNQRQRGVMEVIATSTTVLDRLPFESIEGNAFQYDMEATLPASAFRAVNAGYTESTGTTTSATESLVILGGEAVVDRFLQQTRSNLNNLLALQTRMKAKSVQAKFSDTFINGDTAVDANSFNGLKKRLTGGQVISMGTNGAAINTDNTVRHAFFDKLDELQSLVPGIDVFYANASVLAKFRSAARQTSQYSQSVDNIGRTTDFYNGIPILDIGNKADGTPIIPQTETQGTSTIASSIYAVRFTDTLGEMGVAGLTNGGLQVDPPVQLETKPSWMVRLEWYCGLALFGPKPAARLTGVLAS